MQSNRIQHFLYTNNIPTGLNYQTDILRSLVQTEGSEYPYSILPNNLPLYVGDSKDSLTKMLTDNPDDVSQECLKDFETIFCKLEVSLANANILIRNAYSNWYDDIIDSLYEYGNMLGQGTALYTIFNIPAILTDKFAEAFNTPEEYAALVAAGVVVNTDLSTGLYQQYSQMKAEWVAYTTELQNNQKRIREITLLLGGTGGTVPDWWSVRTNMTDSKRSQLLGELNRLRLRQAILNSLIRDIVSRFPAVTTWGNNSPSGKQLSKDWVKRARKGSVSIDAIKKILSGFKTILTIFWIVLKRTFLILFNLLNIYLLVELAQAITNAHQKLVDNIDKANRRWKSAITEAAGRGLYYGRDRELACRDYPFSIFCAEVRYEKQIKDMITRGCCDTDSDSGSGSGSGSGIQGVGLTLLMGNKYIPTYYDNINQNYLNTSVEAMPGVNGWKPNCPPKPGSIGGPDCTKCGKIIDPDDRGEFRAYPNNNSWNGCTKQISLGFGSLTVPSSECACGYPDKTGWDNATSGGPGYVEHPPAPYEIGSLFSEGFELLTQGFTDFASYLGDWLSRNGPGSVGYGGM